MDFKFITILISTLSLSSPLKADNTTKNLIPPPKTIDFQNGSLREPLKHFQDIHHFDSTFDDYQLGGIAYESFNYTLM